PTATAVAQRLGMSRRTLYRRLRDEGTTFQHLLDDLRAGMAQSLLKNRHTDLTEVAFILGFSEPRAFSRAFKRWTGTTPARWRNEMRRNHEHS
ncbi:MAG: helix-turn-helix transcriptional regulator, partial [Myxococcota bacterium]